MYTWVVLRQHVAAPPPGHTALQCPLSVALCTVPLRAVFVACAEAEGEASTAEQDDPPHEVHSRGAGVACVGPQGCRQ